MGQLFVPLFFRSRFSIQSKIANSHAPTIEWTNTVLHLATRRNQLSPVPLYKTPTKLHKSIPSETSEFFLYVRAQGIQDICSSHPRRLPDNTTAGGDIDYDPRCPCCKFMLAPTHNHPTPLGTPKHILRECPTTEVSRMKLDNRIEEWYVTRKLTDTSRRTTLQRWADIPDNLKHALLMGTTLPHNYQTTTKQQRRWAVNKHGRQTSYPSQHLSPTISFRPTKQ